MNLLRTLSHFPSGRTIGELYSILKIGDDSRQRVDLLQQLKALAAQNLIVRDPEQRWKCKSTTTDRQNSDGLRGSTYSLESEVLQAAPATFSPFAAQRETLPEEPQPGAGEVTLSRLLKYYRSAIGIDSRGAVQQTGDMHGINFQIISGSGEWMPMGDNRSEIRIKTELLPDTFREALEKRRKDNANLALGWPLEVGESKGVPCIWPVGLLAANWTRKGEEIILNIESDNILINPLWIDAATRISSWTKGNLQEVFNSRDAGLGIPFEDFKGDLAEVAATRVKSPLNGPLQALVDIRQPGLYNSLSVFLSNQTTYIKGVISDLDALAAFTNEELQQTALASVFGLDCQSPEKAAPVVHTAQLNADQIQAVENAMTQTLTVVQGPPGTGKSQTISAMVASAVLDGQTVVVGSRNHAALDAIQDRLKDVAPEEDFMVRTLDAGKETNNSVAKTLGDIVKSPPSTRNPQFIEDDISVLYGLVQARQLAICQLVDRETWLRQLESYRQRQAALSAVRTEDMISQGDSEAAEKQQPRDSWLQRLLRVLFGAVSRLPNSPVMKLERLIQEKEQQLARLPEEIADPIALTEKITALSRTCLAAVIQKRTRLNGEQLRQLENARRDKKLSKKRDLPKEVVEQVLGARPLWLVSVMGVGARIPLYPGLFDLAIIDEASQCDIGITLPTLARAKRIAIIGDDRQLKFIPPVGVEADRNLLLTHGLPLEGKYAQSSSSLLDLALAVSDNPVTLRTQYRSAKAIVDFISEEFYEGQLSSAADAGKFALPKGQRPGIAWTHVPGPMVVQPTGENINKPEVSAIADHLHNLLQQQGYEGTVGVVTPFNVTKPMLSRMLWKNDSPHR